MNRVPFDMAASLSVSYFPRAKFISVGICGSVGHCWRIFKDLKIRFFFGKSKSKAEANCYRQLFTNIEEKQILRTMEHGALWWTGLRWQVITGRARSEIRNCDNTRMRSERKLDEEKISLPPLTSALALDKGHRKHTTTRKCFHPCDLFQI